MHVFLDTNILLSLYKLSGTDLEELKKVVKLVEAGKLVVHSNSNVVDEFYRNREGVISECLAQFSQVKGSQVVPGLLTPNPKAGELRKVLAQAGALVKDLLKQAREDVRTNNLEADKLVGELFKLSKPGTIPGPTVERAHHRRMCGNPPGTSARLGDAINWEWLLTAFPQNQELHLVSADGDYESAFHKGEARQFLQLEWVGAKHAPLVLHKSLPTFLKEKFPDIKLADEIEKVFAVEKLENSWNFAATHEALANLEKYSDFSEDLLLRMLKAYNANNQIHWILSDPDVRLFAESLLKQAKSKELEDERTQLMLKLMELDKPKPAPFAPAATPF